MLRVREPDWFEHRLFKGPRVNINLHVFSAGCEETRRMLAFRDHLRTDAVDRALYQRTKEELAARTWRHVQHYADAKSTVVARDHGPCAGPAGGGRAARVPVSGD